MQASSVALRVVGCADNRAGAIISTAAAGANNSSAETRSLYFTAPGRTRFVGGQLHRRMYGYRFSTAGAPSWAFGYRLIDETKQVIENCGGGSTSATRGSCVDDPNGSIFRSSLVTLPARSTKYYTVTVGCWVAGKCAHYASGPGLTEVSGEFAVQDTGFPAVNSITGAPATEGVVTDGTDDVAISASDIDGLGVYRVRFVVGGKDVGSEPWDLNGGACFDYDPSARRLFRAGQPCLESPRTRTFAVPATTDGEQRVQAIVEDAAGNESRALDRYVTIDRLAPVLSEDPKVAGVAQVGRQLTCSIGGVDGQQPSTAYQWIRTRADGSGAADIAGATGTSYQPVAADAGSKLLCRATVSDRGGSSSRTSSATAGPFVGGATVAGPAGGSTTTPNAPGVPNVPGAPGAPGTNGGTGTNGSDGAAGTSTNGSGPLTLGSAAATAPGPAGPGSTQGPALPAPGCPIGTIVTLEGPSRLVTKRVRSAAAVAGVVCAGTGAPAAGVVVELVQRVRRSTAESPLTVATSTSGIDGRFSLKAPVGPSRDLQVITRSCGASGPVVGQTVRGSVRLKAITRRVRNGQSARFRGQVLGGYYGKGVGLELQVLVGRQWRDVRAVKTDRKGRFTTSYRFKRTYVRFTYRFRIATRAGASWPYTATRSAVAKVQVN